MLNGTVLDANDLTLYPVYVALADGSLTDGSLAEGDFAAWLRRHLRTPGSAVHEPSPGYTAR